MHLKDLKGLTLDPATDGHHHKAFDLSLDTWSHFPRRARDASATTFLFGSFQSQKDHNVFGEEVEEWNSDCPPFLPDGRSHKHGFCRKLDPVKQDFYPPANPEPRPGVQPTASPASPQKPRVPVEKPQVPFELPAQTIREEQKLVVQEPQVPFTAQSPQKTQATEATLKMTRQQHKEMKHKDKIEPPFVGPEAAEDVSPPPSAARPAPPAPPVEVDPGEPRPPLIVEQKTSAPSKGPEIGIVEDDPSPEEELLEAEPWNIGRFFRGQHGYSTDSRVATVATSSLVSLVYLSYTSLDAPPVLSPGS